MLSSQEVQRLRSACSQLPKGPDYRDEDYVSNLLTTVLDFQLRVETVNAAIKHYEETHWDEIRNHVALKEFIAHFPDTKEGNIALANSLWSNNCWTRAKFLRQLVEYLESKHVCDKHSLRKWIEKADFNRDVRGRVRTQHHSIGVAIFEWLRLRVGIDTVKPDLHVRRFVEQAIGRRPSDEEVVEGLISIATALGRECYELDAAIWHKMRDSA
jgi:hypothetical protein